MIDIQFANIVEFADKIQYYVNINIEKTNIK